MAGAGHGVRARLPDRLHGRDRAGPREGRGHPVQAQDLPAREDGGEGEEAQVRDEAAGELHRQDGRAGQLGPGHRGLRQLHEGQPAEEAGGRRRGREEPARLRGARPRRPAEAHRERARGRLQGDPRQEGRDRGPDPGLALHGLRHALLPPERHRQVWLPAGQPHPRVERPRAQGAVARGLQEAAEDQQLPRVHGPRLPGAVRGLLHSRHH
mmetsp:Transcript_84340/g.217205  ORF Transcript_84340/g.217205 Transcript_84340/m.217205 type:complete len:211 (-) Transcript_84340:512-1144(-)